MHPILEGQPHHPAVHLAEQEVGIVLPGQRFLSHLLQHLETASHLATAQQEGELASPTLVSLLLPDSEEQSFPDAKGIFVEAFAGFAQCSLSFVALAIMKANNIFPLLHALFIEAFLHDLCGFAAEALPRRSIHLLLFLLDLFVHSFNSCYQVATLLLHLHYRGLRHRDLLM